MASQPSVLASALATSLVSQSKPWLASLKQPDRSRRPCSSALPSPKLLPSSASWYSFF
ncbi:UNVERIFIED_CONTAM: hypothetical protein GTU68_012390, partial [Idotea baltica]|nr:hypothetical protein [Idotea baltica]